ncbi:MAG: VOC family protein [Oceanospirillaceae bacterium]
MSAENTVQTQGLNHLGLSVKNLTATTDFFVNLLGWEMSGFDASYPRCAVSDGALKLTLWQVEDPQQVADFSRRQNLGLHHLALTVVSELKLQSLHLAAAQYSGVKIEFAPELLAGGPRKHMMCTEPGGLRKKSL